MFIIDSHLDLAWNALQWNRDLLQPVSAIRTAESGQAGAGRSFGTVALPEMRRGRVAICFATLLARSTGHPEPYVDYASLAQAYGIAQGQLAYYRALEAQEHIRVLMNPADITQHISDWTQWESDEESAAPPLGVVISMESADPILNPEQLAAW